jgi:hypothetical protein
MSKAKQTRIEVQGTSVAVLSRDRQDYISLTDIARYKDAERTDYLISNWLRNRNTIEFLGIWERLNNPAFNPIEFDGIRKQAGVVRQGLPAPERLLRLNEIAITQMRTLLADSNLKRLK